MRVEFNVMRILLAVGALVAVGVGISAERAIHDKCPGYQCPSEAAAKVVTP